MCAALWEGTPSLALYASQLPTVFNEAFVLLQLVIYA